MCIKKMISLGLCLSVICMGTMLSACDITKSDSKNTTNSDDSESNITKFDINVEYENEDLQDTYDSSKASTITLNNDEIKSDSNSVTIEENKAVITSSGTYVITGKLDDGQIEVDCKTSGVIRLVLKDASISNSTNSPIFVKNAEKTIITLDANTNNEIADTRENNTSEEEDSSQYNAAIYSKTALVVNGSGKLSVTANYNHAIQSKDTLTLISGDYTINSYGDSIVGKDAVILKEPTINIESQADGIKSTKEKQDKGYIYIDDAKLTILAKNDAIQVATCMVVNDGEFTLTTDGGYQNSTKSNEKNQMGFGNMKNQMQNNNVTQETTSTNTDNTDNTSDSFKGIKAGVDITVNGGTYTINSKDDAIHSNNSIVINDGIMKISAGDDGIHSDLELEINKGTISVEHSYEGLESKSITINDGDIDVTSDDDGINAASKNVDSNSDSAPNNQQFDNQNGNFNQTPPDMPQGQNDSNNTNNTNETPPDMPQRQNNSNNTNNTNETPPDMPQRQNDSNNTNNTNETPPDMPQRQNDSNNTNNTNETPPDMPQNNAGTKQDKLSMGKNMGESQNSDNILTINGGTIRVNASGDGLDVNGQIVMNGGKVYVTGPTNDGNGALDYDTGFTMNGGEIIAVGSSGMAMGTTSESTQYSFLATLNNSYKSGNIVIKDSLGNEIVQYETTKSFQSVVYSSDKLKNGETYTIYIDGTEDVTFTLSDITNTVGNANVGRSGMNGGMRGGRK